MKHLFLLISAMLFCNLLHAQIEITQTGPGTYAYNSLFQSSDLHFYLYGDGYHNFNADNFHEFESYANGQTAKVYHSEPYDIDAVEELILNTVNDGLPFAEAPAYYLPNKVAIKSSWSLVNKEDNFFILMFENNEDDNPISGCIEFHFDANDSDIVGSSILDDHNNDWVDPNQSFLTSDQPGFTHRYVWTFENLKKDEQRFIYIPAECLAGIFDVVETRAVMKVDNCEETHRWDRDSDGSLPGINSSPIFTLRSQVRNFPHDPNSIVADPNCLSPLDELYTVRYTIHFQNDGTDPVQNVGLDFLVKTPFRTIELVDASNPCELEWNYQSDEYADSDNVEIKFFDIFLLGSGATPPPAYERTHGYVTFDICFNLAVFTALELDCAHSIVNIHFDHEEPVSATNEICRNCRNLPTGSLSYNIYDCPELLAGTQTFGHISHKITNTETINIERNKELQVSPNPANDLLYINVQDFAKNDLIKVRNAAGEIIIQKYVKEIGQSLNLSGIPAGVYYISLQNEKSVKTKPFVKL